MASVEDLRAALAALAQTTADQAVLTNDAIQRLAAVTLGAVSTGYGAGPAVGMTALQIVRKSSEPTVQLSLSDTQYTVSELSPVGVAPPTGLRLVDILRRQPGRGCSQI